MSTSMDYSGTEKKLHMSSVLNAFGHRSLTQTVDALGLESPNRIFGSYPSVSNSEFKFRDVSFRELASAVDWLAWELQAFFAQTELFETISFIGVPDFRYTIVILAAIKCRYKTILLGPHNGEARNKRLLRISGCKKMLFTSETSELTKNLRAADMASFEIPALDYILKQIPLTRFVFDMDFDKIQHDPIILTHSSGSTGHPKITTMTHGTVAITDNDRQVPCPHNRQLQNASQFEFGGSGCFYSSFPPFHLAGLQSYLLLPILYGATIVIGPANLPPSGQVIRNVIDHQSQLVAIYTPPSLIKQWVADYNGLQQASRLKFILFGGGPLDAAVGDALEQLTNVCQMYGSTETGQIQVLSPLKGQWSYLEFNPFEEVVMEPRGDGLHELTLQFAEKFLPHRSLYQNVGRQEKWYSGDLFSQHPSKPGLWKFEMRADDIIVLATGYKVYPQTIEAVISIHPWVSGVLVVGQDRSRLAVLIELRNTLSTAEILYARKSIWPYVQRSTAELPGHSFISRTQIVTCDFSRPMVRTPKGTVVRKLTEQLYSFDLELCLLQRPTHVVSRLSRNASIMYIRSTIRRVISFYIGTRDFEDDTDLYTLGIDSLRSMEIVKTLCDVQPIDYKGTLVSLNTIYQHPSVLQLAEAIHEKLIAHGKVPRALPSVSVMTLVDKYTQSLPFVRLSSREKRGGTSSVLLTGWTGKIGSHLLQSLCQDQQITRIYCLRRQGTNKHVKHNEQDEQPNLKNKVTFLDSDMSKPYLGLQPDQYDLLISEVSVVVHLAWSVDFNLSLQSFDAELLPGLRNLINFCLAGRLAPTLIFSSSGAYAMSWAQANGQILIPEDLLKEPLVGSPGVNGYAESKQVAELFLGEAHRRSGLSVQIMRMTHVLGPLKRGREASNDWVDALIDASTYLRMVPMVDIPSQWIQRHDAIAILRNATKSAMDRDTASSQFSVYNLANPELSNWIDLANAIARNTEARLVSFPEWLAGLKACARLLPVPTGVLPAIKLLSFFESMSDFSARGHFPMFETEATAGSNAAFRNMKPISEYWRS